MTFLNSWCVVACLLWARFCRRLEHLKHTLQLHRYLVKHHLSVYHKYISDRYFLRPLDTNNTADTELSEKCVDEADLLQVTASIGDEEHALTLLTKCIVRHMRVQDYTVDVCKTILHVANLPTSDPVVVTLVYLNAQGDLSEKRVFLPRDDGKNMYI